METSDIVYDRRGQRHGTPIVLLHGLGHRRQGWYPVLDRLAARHEVIVPDLPGFGESPAPASGSRYDIPALVDTVERWFADLGLHRPHVVGNSLGGAIALELGARGAVSSVTAFSPIGFTGPLTGLGARLMARGVGIASLVPEPVRLAVADTRPARALATRMLRGEASSSGRDGGRASVRFDATALNAGSAFVRLAPHVADYVYPAPPGRRSRVSRRRRAPRSVAALAGLALLQHAQRTCLVARTRPPAAARRRPATRPAPSCPVTIAWGDHDRLLPAASARRALARISHARLVTLLGCGHIPMADNPSAVARAILQTCQAAE